MAIRSETIANTISSYLDVHPDDRDSLAFVLELLQNGVDLISGSDERALVTVGAILVDSFGRVLHVADEGQWVLPAGPIEEDDVKLSHVALRVLTALPGVDSDGLCPIAVHPTHIHVHQTPECAKEGNQRRRVEIRYFYRASNGLLQRIIEAEGSNQLRMIWEDKTTLVVCRDPTGEGFPRSQHK